MAVLCLLGIITFLAAYGVQLSYRALLACMCHGAYCVRVMHCDSLNSLAIGWLSIASAYEAQCGKNPKELWDTVFLGEIVRVRLPGKWKNMEAMPDVQQPQTWEKCRDPLACVVQDGILAQ